MADNDKDQSNKSLLSAAAIGVGKTVVSLRQKKEEPKLVGQIVLITGGSRGLGLLLSHEFARQGAKIVICARDEQELAQARQQLEERGAEVMAIPCDITDRVQAQNMIQQATEAFGRIDILVNNAGIITVGPLMAQTLEDFREAMDIMFWGMFYTTMAVLPQMLDRKEGRIVNITSIGGKVSVPHLLPYDSAKFAAVGFSEGLRAEMAKEGVKVITIAPGLMRTGSEINAYFKGNNRKEYTWFTVLGSLPVLSMSAEKAAQKIVQATYRGSAEAILGFPAKMLAKFHGLFPGATTGILGLINRFLPGAGPVWGLERHTGKESETPVTQSFITGSTQKAAQEYNQT
ncbi:MAG TPA: SDR family oxidoreductase [Ktedonobacteraceae bacterium]|nr:SDR family oxidoreductase [Ktedonobacteraceae bacterium]